MSDTRNPPSASAVPPAPASAAARWFNPGQLINLVYLGNLAWQPAFADTGAGGWQVAGAIAVAFVPLFVLSHHPQRRVTRPVIAATVALAGVGSLFNVGAATLLVYAGVTAVWTEERRVAVRLIGAFAIFSLLLLGVSTVDWPYRAYGILPATFFLWVVGVQQLAANHKAAEAVQLRVDNVRIEQLSAASERERIARDMHDILGQSLTALIVRAQLVQSLAVADPERAAEHAAQLEDTARTALQQLRGSVTGMRELSLEDEADMATRTLAAAGVLADIDVRSGLSSQGAAPSPLAERTLALALREAVTNVVRHARARSCQVRLTDDRGSWRLQVSDDGVGLPAGATGNGLDGMRERALAVGGAAEVAHGPSRGTRVTVRVPR